MRTVYRGRATWTSWSGTASRTAAHLTGAGWSTSRRSVQTTIHDSSDQCRVWSWDWETNASTTPRPCLDDGVVTSRVRKGKNGGGRRDSKKLRSSDVQGFRQ